MQVLATKEPESTLPPATLCWQFGLKDLFGLMTFAALASALVVWFGPGSLTMSLGFLIAILNQRGLFARWQKGRAQFVLLVGAWLVFLISLATPCAAIFSGYVWGWHAAWIYLAGPFERLFGQQGMEWGPQWFWVLAIDMTNVLMAILPILMWRQSHRRGQWLAAALCLAMPGVWVTNWRLDLYVGYYVWLASTLLVLIAIPIRGKMFAAMLASGILLAAIVLWFHIV